MEKDNQPASRWIVRDKNGNAYGPFDDLADIGAWAAKKWPGEEQDERRSGKGWDIELLRPAHITSSGDT